MQYKMVCATEANPHLFKLVKMLCGVEAGQYGGEFLNWLMEIFDRLLPTLLDCFMSKRRAHRISKRVGWARQLRLERMCTDICQDIEGCDCPKALGMEAAAMLIDTGFTMTNAHIDGCFDELAAMKQAA
jgi:hypothetical protein